MRTYTCTDCGSTATAGARGPLPIRCDPCRATHAAERMTARRRRAGWLERGSPEHRAMRSRVQSEVEARSRRGRLTSAA